MACMLSVVAVVVVVCATTVDAVPLNVRDIPARTQNGAKRACQMKTTNMTACDLDYVATFSGGSFLALRDAFLKQPGVGGVRIGYTGGFKRHPTYADVCAGVTGHAEAVEVTYSRWNTTFETLVEAFLSAHDTAKLDTAGGELEGTQFRSVIFAHNRYQWIAANKAVARLRAERKRVVTEVKEEPFYAVAFYEETKSDVELLRVRTATVKTIAARMMAMRANATPTPTSEKEGWLAGVPFPAASDELEEMQSPMAPLPSHYPKQYIIFEPWVGGPNNRRISLETVTVLALLLNRTLILPPIPYLPNGDMYHDPGVRQLAFQHYYNLTVMKSAIPVLTWAEALRHNVLASVLERPRLRNITCLYPRAGCNRLKPYAERVFSFGGDHKEGHANDPSFGIHRGEWPKIPDGETVVHMPYRCCFVGFYCVARHIGQPGPERARYYRAIRDAFQFTDEIKALSAEWVHRMGGVDNFSCMHVRLSDFKAFDLTAYREADFLVDKFYDLFPKNSTIFIASDEDSRVRKRLRDYAEFRFFTMTDMLKIGRPTTVHKTLFPVVSQLTCSKSAVFVANHRSTYSALITRLRGYRAAPPPAAHYIDDDPTLMTERRAGYENSQLEHPDSWTHVEVPPTEVATHELTAPYPDAKVVRRSERLQRDRA